MDPRTSFHLTQGTGTTCRVRCYSWDPRRLSPLRHVPLVPLRPPSRVWSCGVGYGGGSVDGRQRLEAYATKTTRIARRCRCTNLYVIGRYSDTTRTTGPPDPFCSFIVEPHTLPRRRRLCLTGDERLGPGG